MLPPLSRGLRLALIAGLAMSYVAAHGHNAFAKKHGDDDSGDSDDSDDSDSGSDKDSDDTGDGEENPDKDQPPVTSGGLFTLKTYPTSEIARPLTITKGVTQLRLSIGTDISAKGAFDTAGVSLDAVYGVRDNFQLIAGMDTAYNFHQYSFYAGFEGALVYDLLDIRLAADLHRSAVPSLTGAEHGVPGYGYFCDPPATPNEMPVGGASGTCTNPNATIDLLPTGSYVSGGTQFSLDLGFPFRYAFVPQFAIVALQTLMAIDFNSVAVDHINVIQTMDDAGNMINVSVPTGNSAKPDLEPSIALAVNPIPQLSIVAMAQLRIIDFDTAAGNFQVPVTLRIEAAASSQLDFGLAFTLLNVDPPDPQGPLDNRFISAYVTARY